MEFLTKRKYFRILSFILIITTYLPVLTKNLPPIIRSHHLWAPIWIISLIALFPTIFKNKFFIYVIFYQVVFLLFVLADFWIDIDNWTIKALGYDIYYFTIAFSLITYYRYSNDYKGLASLVKWALIFIGITAIMSIYSSFIDPLYARKITGGDYEGLQEVFKYGGGTYGYASALVGLFPIMFYYFRNNSDSIFSKTQILIFGVVCFFALIKIQIFANIIISLFVILISFFGRKNLRRSLLISTVFLMVILAIPEKSKADLMVHLSALFNKESENKQKLDDLNDYLYSGDKSTMTGTRIARYPLLWGALKENPFMGHFFKESDYKIGDGAHLYFMYRLTAFGILNFIFFTLIFFNHIKINIKIFNEGFSFYFLLSALSIIVLGLIKNLAGRELWYIYFFVIPGLYYLPVIKKQINQKSLMGNDG